MEEPHLFGPNLAGCLPWKVAVGPRHPQETGNPLGKGSR